MLARAWNSVEAVAIPDGGLLRDAFRKVAILGIRAC